ncbi:MAG: FKBP-type peptidyl-prolyl cis-trans isomerase [Acidobacteria bacterium]|nr:FKBP-type peptidyl-prolyl cis-trans isomerase [Acidobacteriota bacterium]
MAVPILAAGILLLGSAQAQETPAAKTEPAPAAKAKTAPAAKTAKTPPAKAAPAKPTAKAPGAAASKGAGVTTLKTTKEKFSYALGMNLGANFHKQAVDVDPNLVAQGIRAAMAGGKTLLTEAEAQAALTEVQTELRKKQMEKMQVTGEANKKEGDSFLEANKGKEGVTALPSGLQYKILTAGTGPKPSATDSVVCNYRGTLINGKEFDSSYKRGQPATFPVNGVIKGWTEALQLMPAGSKWQLFIPSSLAYGERGAGGDIGPNATLIFEVELMSIQEKAKTEDKK